MSAATRPQLDWIGAAIFQDAVNQLDQAEEIGGPEGDDYVRLMEAVIAEAKQRIANFKSSRPGAAS